MREQKVVVIKGLTDVEDKINEEITLNQKQGWYVKQITSHASNISIWTILFEREVIANGNE